LPRKRFAAELLSHFMRRLLVVLQANQHLAQQSKSYKLPYRMYLKPLK